MSGFRSPLLFFLVLLVSIGSSALAAEPINLSLELTVVGYNNQDVTVQLDGHKGRFKIPRSTIPLKKITVPSRVAANLSTQQFQELSFKAMAESYKVRQPSAEPNKTRKKK